MPFEIFQSENTSKYHFRLKAKNGEIILQSEAYESMESAENGVQSVVKNAKDEKNFEEKVAKDEQHYFVLKASNGSVIGKSELYKSKSGMQNGIRSVQENAKDEKVKDLTA